MRGTARQWRGQLRLNEEHKPCVKLPSHSPPRLSTPRLCLGCIPLHGWCLESGSVCLCADGRINRRNVGKKKVKITLAHLQKLDPALAEAIVTLSATLGYDLGSKKKAKAGTGTDKVA
jgi:hypothetical protein